MSTKNNGGAAFPMVDSPMSGLRAHEGMALRDYFAAKAMQGLMSVEDDSSRDQCASLSYLMADAMLSARDGIVGGDSGRVQLMVALQSCVSVMERELNGLAVIQPELRQARAALAATGAQ